MQVEQLGSGEGRSVRPHTVGGVSGWAGPASGRGRSRSARAGVPWLHRTFSSGCNPAGALRDSAGAGPPPASWPQEVPARGTRHLQGSHGNQAGPRETGGQALEAGSRPDPWAPCGPGLGPLGATRPSFWGLVTARSRLYPRPWSAAWEKSLTLDPETPSPVEAPPGEGGAPLFRRWETITPPCSSSRPSAPTPQHPLKIGLFHRVDLAPCLHSDPSLCFRSGR